MPRTLPLLCLLFVLGPHDLISQTYYEYTSQANELYQAKKYQESSKAWDLAFKAHHGFSSDYYNSACTNALAGNSDKAFDHLEKAIKTEADTKGDDINQGKLDMVKKGEKKPVDPEPKIGKSIKEMMKKKKDDVATTADTEKDKEKKATTLVGYKKTPVDTKPEIEYKN